MNKATSVADLVESSLVVARDSGRAFFSKFARGDKVTIDGDHDLVATVTAHTFRQDYAIVEVSYAHNGELKASWIEDWRLTLYKK